MVIQSNFDSRSASNGSASVDHESNNNNNNHIQFGDCPSKGSNDVQSIFKERCGCPQPPSAIKLLSLKLITLTTIISFLWSGLTVNLLQLLNYITVRHLNFSLFIRINYYLMYSVWSQIIGLFDWSFGSQLRVYHAKREQEEEIFSEHNIFLANHSYELDWIGAWLATDKFGQAASCKAMLKSDLKYLPVVGWSWAMSDQLFLDRNWEKDKHKFGSSMDQLLRYQPMIATFFCEGTRFTRDKIEASQKFAQERGIVAPKYHLIPRTKGFVAVMRHIKQRCREQPDLKISLYNAQIAFEPEGAMNIGEIMRQAKQPKGHLYFEKISIDSVPDDEEKIAQWLIDLYLSKDRLQEHFDKHNCFPGHLDKRFLDYKPRLASLINWTTGILYTMLPLVWMVAKLYARFGALHVSLLMSVFFMLSYVYLNYIIYQADVSSTDKSSSNGEEKSKRKQM